MTPQAAILLAAALLLFGAYSASKRETDSATALERRVAQTLSGMAGAGKVDVVIMTKSEAQGTQSGLLGASGAQTREVPCGAIAVAQGADDPLVCMQLTQALCALLGLPASAVSIVTGGN